MVKTNLGCCDNEIEVKIFCRKCKKEMSEEATLKYFKFATDTYKEMKENK